ncbi:MAG: hypothetical protein Q9183_007082, partial [Haloplaca sp. 2 TL-2023]
VRSPATSANLVLSLKVPRDGVIVPEIQSQTVAMTPKSTVGPYNIVSATYALDAAQVQSTTFDVTLGSGAADAFKGTGDLGTTCVDLDSTALRHRQQQPPRYPATTTKAATRTLPANEF